MGPADFLIHMTNFAAPALALAVLLALLTLVVERTRFAVRAVWWQAIINSIVGMVVLTAGLWYFGRDGRMATYAALVAVMATSQWLLSRAWR